jgi:NDP-mannose synthase
VRAVILAGGQGTRLRPYTVVLPKPLMPIGEYPILEVIVRQLVFFGFKHITMAVNHQAEIIRSFFNSGSKWGIKIDYSLEKEPLGTMGPLKLIDDLPEDFMVMNGDILSDLDFHQFHNYHVFKGNIFTISAYQREQKTEYGVLEINNQNYLTGFKEKPVTKYDVSMGIYMLNRSVLDYIPPCREYGFDNLMADLLKAEHPAAVKRFDGYWLDIGRPDDYMQAIDEFEGLKDNFIRQ